MSECTDHPVGRNNRQSRLVWFRLYGWSKCVYGRTWGADYVRWSLYPEGVPQNFQKKLAENGLDPELFREHLIDWADELSMMGLDKVAAVVLEVAELKPSRFDEPLWPTASRYCRESAQREREQWELKRKWQATYGRLWTGHKVPEERFWHSYDTQKCWHSPCTLIAAGHQGIQMAYAVGH